jgi:hypothetical protein
MRLSSFGRGSEIQVIGERIIAKPRFQTVWFSKRASSCCQQLLRSLLLSCFTTG